MSTSDSSSAAPRGVRPTLPEIGRIGPGVDEPAFAKPGFDEHDAALNRPVQRPLPLPPAESRRRKNLPQQSLRPRHLWLGIHLPLLPLEALRRQRRSAGTCAVFEERDGVRRILLADTAAEKRGIAAGLPVNAALALVPGLELLPRDPAREARALEDLAARAGRFTSLVSIEAADGLLLEIAGSLKLFGGNEALRRQIEAELAGAGLSATLAVAPTPLASSWLARSGKATTVAHTEYLAGALGPLPLDCLRWPDSVCETLNGMGITAIGDCLRLPREGFARRFGALRLLQLDRALGRLPDPRASYRAPERFCREYELDEEEDDRELLLGTCRHLLEVLERFLIARQVAVQRLKFVFFHLKTPATRLTIGGLEPGYSACHWQELLAMKLDRLVLPAPVIAIRLESGQTQACSAATGDLPFRRNPEQSEPAQTMPATQLIERLAARIGDDRVHGVTIAAEHRPQRAWRPVHANGPCIVQCDLPRNEWYARRSSRVLCGRESDRLLLERPLWILEEPAPLDLEQAVPQYQGPLRLESGPERLETGWWDGEDIARDYFVAVNPRGVHLWIYRDRRHGRDCNGRNSRHGREVHDDWYLHGIFA